MSIDIFREHKWQLPELLFVIAGCFSMGAIGFFMAVYLQTRTIGISSYENSQQVPVGMKEKVIGQVSVSGLQPAPQAAPRNQSDETDPNAAAKLKLLQKLDAAK